MRTQLLAAGALVAVAAFVTVPVAAGLDIEGDLDVAQARRQSAAAAGVAEAAHRVGVGPVVEVVQLHTL
jgi:hypothetical protein